MERLATGRELVLKQVVGAATPHEIARNTRAFAGYPSADAPPRQVHAPPLGVEQRNRKQQHRQKGDETEGAVWAAALTRLRLAHIPAALFGITFPPFFVA